MKYLYYDIPHEEMTHYRNIPHSQARDEFVDKYVSQSILLGYGLYGVTFLEDEDKVKIATGDSCD